MCLRYKLHMGGKLYITVSLSLGVTAILGQTFLVVEAVLYTGGYSATALALTYQMPVLCPPPIFNNQKYP